MATAFGLRSEKTIDTSPAGRSRPTPITFTGIPLARYCLATSSTDVPVLFLPSEKITTAPKDSESFGLLIPAESASPNAVFLPRDVTLHDSLLILCKLSEKPRLSTFPYSDFIILNQEPSSPASRKGRTSSILRNSVSSSLVFILPDKSARVSKLNSLGFGSFVITYGLANKTSNRIEATNLNNISFHASLGSVTLSNDRP